MKRVKKEKKEKKGDRGLKRLGIAALLSVVFCGLLGFGVLYYYFAPRDSGLVVFEVPRLVGLDESGIGEVEGLEISREWIYSDDVERGTVISQTPHANARRKIAPGARCPITLYISLGERTGTVPELCGIDSLSAAAALRSIGARVRTVAIYGEGEDGLVIGTSPSAKSEIREGDTVTVFVSRRRVRPAVEVPNFCGMEYSEAVRLALSLGLFVSGDEDEGTVVSQSIPQGARVVADSYISFDVDGDLREREWPPIIEKRATESP